MSEKFRFFVGIGMQKCGTTWIADYLWSHPGVSMSPVKELHFFDSIYTHRLFSNKEFLFPHIKKLLSKRKHDPLITMRIIMHYLGTHAFSETSYRSFLEGVAAGKPVGEITPAYALLPQRGFRAIERVLACPRYILIFRNPADRLLSQIKMKGMDRSEQAMSRPSSLLALRSFRRADYRRTIETLSSVVDMERVHIMFFEDLFSPERHASEVAKLCNFLGVETAPSELARNVNRGRSATAVQWNRADAVTSLAPQYVYFAEKFGKSLPESWREDLQSLVN